MTSGKGWIKLWRKTQDSDMYQSLNSKQRDVMMNILMLANHEERTWEWQGELQICKPGQFKTSLSSLEKVCADDVSIQNIRTAIKKLKKWDFITNKSTKSGRIITVVHWEDYQVKGDDTNKDDNKEVTNSQQRGNKEVTTNKNVKNYKELKNDKNKDNSSGSEPPEENSLKFDENSTQYQLALQLRERIVDFHNPTPGNIPKPNPEDMDKWSYDIDKLIRLGEPGGEKDGPTPKQVKFIFHWIYDIDDFWRDTVKSPHGIRKNLSTITAQVRKWKKNKNGNGRIKGKSQSEYMQELAEEMRKEEENES